MGACVTEDCLSICVGLNSFIILFTDYLSVWFVEQRQVSPLLFEIKSGCWSGLFLDLLDAQVVRRHKRNKFGVMFVRC